MAGGGGGEEGRQELLGRRHLLEGRGRGAPLTGLFAPARPCGRGWGGRLRRGQGRRPQGGRRGQAKQAAAASKTATLQTASSQKGGRNPTVCDPPAWLSRRLPAQGHRCFEHCGAARNVSSSCWVHCFYDTVLGPGAAGAQRLPLLCVCPAAACLFAAPPPLITPVTSSARQPDRPTAPRVCMALL